MGRDKKDSLNERVASVTRAVWRQFDRQAVNDEPAVDMNVHHVFEDAAIIEDMVSEKLFEVPYNVSEEGDVEFGEPTEVMEEYVAKRASEAGVTIDLAGDRFAAKHTQLTGPIVMKNEEQRIAYAAVLVPGEPDSDGEILTAEKIEEAAHGWMAGYRNVDYMHTLNNVGAPVESYILPMDMEVEAFSEKMVLPKGTWVLASKLEQATWDEVVAGTLTGYSVMGIRRTAPELQMAAKSEGDVIDVDRAAFKRTLLEDLGPDWIAAFVSVVDAPAVPKAKFFALKCKEPASVEPTAPVDIRIVDGSHKQSVFDLLKQAIGLAAKDTSSGEEVLTVTTEELQASIIDATKAAVNEVVDELSARVGKLEEQLAGKTLADGSNEHPDAKVDAAEEAVADEAVVEDEAAEQVADVEDDAADAPAEDAPAEDDADKAAADAEVEELRAFKAEIEGKLEDVSKRVARLTTSSKSLPVGDEAPQATEPATKSDGRDAFGRRVKN